MTKKPKIKKIHIPQHCSVSYDVAAIPDDSFWDMGRILETWYATGLVLYDSEKGNAPTFFPLPKDAGKIKKQPKKHFKF